MKIQTLRNLIQEEVRKLLSEADVIPSGPDGNKVTDRKVIGNLNLALKSLRPSVRPKLIQIIEDPEAAKELKSKGQRTAVLAAIAIAFGISAQEFSEIAGSIKGLLTTSTVADNDND
jgi:hypothetical protein